MSNANIIYFIILSGQWLTANTSSTQTRNISLYAVQFTLLLFIMYASRSIFVNLKWRLFSINSLNTDRKDAPDVLRPSTSGTSIITFTWISLHYAPSLKHLIFEWCIEICIANVTCYHIQVVQCCNQECYLYLDMKIQYIRATGASVLLPLATNLSFQVKCIFTSNMT